MSNNPKSMTMILNAVSLLLLIPLLNPWIIHDGVDASKTGVIATSKKYKNKRLPPPVVLSPNHDVIGSPKATVQRREAALSIDQNNIDAFHFALRLKELSNDVDSSFVSVSFCTTSDQFETLEVSRSSKSLFSEDLQQRQRWFNATKYTSCKTIEIDLTEIYDVKSNKHWFDDYKILNNGFVWKSIIASLLLLFASKYVFDVLTISPNFEVTKILSKVWKSSEVAVMMNAIPCVLWVRGRWVDLVSWNDLSDKLFTFWSHAKETISHVFLQIFPTVTVTVHTMLAEEIWHRFILPTFQPYLNFNSSKVDETNWMRSGRLFLIRVVQRCTKRSIQKLVRTQITNAVDAIHQSWNMMFPTCLLSRRKK